MLSRKKAREAVFKLIFEYLFHKEENPKSLELATSIDMSEKDFEYMRTVYEGVIDKYSDLTSYIEKYSDKFSLNRIYRPDLAALLLAIYEMKYMKDIPMSVSISEAVELVKTYSTEKSHQYVNGILSSVYKELTKDADN
ncbi:MAG TPA: transcription antitermination factor NusB [Clostridia bacterium]|jgi:N utilization substance protein B|nr:transcription antitermination factor NusB [Clostridia bacterium]HOK81445.1 transcription antitermination factor NusB [Clostridia bacterium]